MRPVSTAIAAIAMAAALSACASRPAYHISDVLEARAVSEEGLELFVAGEFSAAIDAFNAVIAYGTVDDRDYTRRAAAYGALKKYDVALRDTERALQLAPREWRTHLQRAVFHQRTHQFDEAIADLDQALEINPDEIELLRRRAYLKVVAGRYMDAVEDYELLSLRAPASNTGTLGRGVALYLAGEWDGAARAFADILRAMPEDGLAVLWLAKATLRTPQPIGWEEFADDAGPEREWTMANLLMAAPNRRVVEDTMVALYGSNEATSIEACEHALFLGTWRLIRDGGNGAERAFKAAAETCPVDSIEGAEARVELVRINGD